MAMMPKTVHGLNAMEAVSAMQKCLRRGMEREAMEFAVELLETSKAYFTMVCNRLEVCAHEDHDVIAQPWLVPMVRSSLEMARDHYKPDRIGEARLMVGNVIRTLAKAAKSREGCHFGAAIGLRAQQENWAPTIPDWAVDVHTHAGRAMGRGLDHFLAEGAKLVPPQAGAPDSYAEEARQRWVVKYAGGTSGRAQGELPMRGGKPGPAKCGSCGDEAPLVDDPFGGDKVCRRCRNKFLDERAEFNRVNAALSRGGR